MIARQITAQPMIVATTMLVNPNDASPLASEAVYAIEMLPWGGERGGLGDSIVLGEGRAPERGGGKRAAMAPAARHRLERDAEAGEVGPAQEQPCGAERLPPGPHEPLPLVAVA